MDWLNSELMGSLINVLGVWVAIHFSVRMLLKDSYDGAINERRELLLRALDNAEVTHFTVSGRFGFDGLSPKEEQTYMLAMLQLAHYEYVYYRYVKGLFPEELWPQWRISMAYIVREELFKAILASDFKHVLWHEFYKFTEELQKDPEAQPKFTSWQRTMRRLGLRN